MSQPKPSPDVALKSKPPEPRAITRKSREAIEKDLAAARQQTMETAEKELSPPPPSTQFIDEGSN